MRKKQEIIDAIYKLRFKTRKGLIPAYEADLCIGALNWVLDNSVGETAWFKYRITERKI